LGRKNEGRKKCADKDPVKEVFMEKVNKNENLDNERPPLSTMDSTFHCQKIRPVDEKD